MLDSRSLRRSALLLACLVGALAPSPFAASGGASSEEVPDFEGLGRSLVARRCGKDATSASCTLDSILAAHYVHAHLGAFRIFVPLDLLQDKQRAGELREIALAVVDMQRRWVELVAPDAERRAALEADAALVRAWIQTWKESRLGELADAPDRDLLVALAAGEDVRAAAGRLRKTIQSRDALGLAPQNIEQIDVVFAPRRRDFMEWVGYAGLADAAQRAALWQAGVDQWTQFWHGRTLFLALEYAPWSGFDPKFETGLSMKKYDAGGLVQHVVQQTAAALVFTCLNRVDLALFEKGLALDLALAVCSEVNTIDGDGAISTSGAATAPYSRFVPGGNPNGGTLPPIPATGMDTVMDNHWREGHGKDHFTAALREGQKLGTKLGAKDRRTPMFKSKLAHFVLTSPTGGKHLVTAPFLGRRVASKQYPPPEYLNDYRELFRSYQTGFLGWVREHGTEGSAEDSAGAFRRVLVALASDASRELDDVFEEAYAQPLSGDDESGASLEWRYLAWLQHGKK